MTFSETPRMTPLATMQVALLKPAWPGAHADGTWLVIETDCHESQCALEPVEACRGQFDK